jgi:signal transduction histidine kinase
MKRGFESDLVLVVDDNETARYTKVRMLRAAGFEVLEAGTAADTLSIVAERRPRLVVLDVHLPDLDGWTVCRRIKENPATASTLVLQVSATFVTEEDTVRALEGGADACLTEPIEAAVLVATARAVLRARVAEDTMRDALAREQSARGIAETANRAKDEFLALLSHELRSPLGAILTWVTLLREGNVDDRLAARGLEAIERNTRVQVKLIEDLLDVSRIVTGKTRLEVGLVELPKVIDAALESVRPAATAKSIRVESSLEPGLGAVLGDLTRLQQVVWNLLSNAVKFTGKDGWVEIRLRRQDSQALIEVADNGKGVDPAFLPFIFERFRQADSSTTRTEGGLGLGLAIVRHVIELHGGTVEAHSLGLGQGATFTVRLPMPALRSTPRTIEASRSRGPALEGVAPGLLDGVKLLVVDDERDARDAIAAVLETSGASVELAPSVRAALARFSSGEVPDVVLSDIAMPEEDGFTLIRELRREPFPGGRRVPALALTAYAGEPEADRIRDAGFDEYLAKPIEASALVAAVARLAGLAG